MEEKDKEMKNGKMISDDELDDVAGGVVARLFPRTSSNGYIVKVSSFNSSGSTPMYEAGTKVKYTPPRGYPSEAVVRGVLSIDGSMFKEFVYRIKITSGEHEGETGDCYEHQISPL